MVLRRRRTSSIIMAMMSLKDLGISVSFLTHIACGFTYSDPGVSVDDLDAACKRFDDLKVNWKKRLTDGRMKTVAFILDPDNYWIEVVQNGNLKNKSEL